MTSVRIGIASYEEIKARTLALARGEIKRAPDDPKIWFNSLKSFAAVFSEENQAMLRAIAEHQPESLAELERLTGRKAGNLSRTFKTMSNYGLVALKPGLSKGGKPPIKPEVPFDSVDLQISIAH